MPIKKQPCWVDSNNETHATLEQCQTAELCLILSISGEDAAAIVNHAAAVMEVLSMSHKSRPMARKVNGGRKLRKGKLAQPELPQPDLPVPPTTE